MAIDEIEKNFYDSEALFGMARLRKRRSRLPMNLYLDDSGSYLNGGHGPRIKFQTDKSDSANTGAMLPMTISEQPEIPVKNYRSQLDGISESDLQRLREFVITNRVNLLRLCDKDDDYDIQEFMNDMIL